MIVKRNKSFIKNYEKLTRKLQDKTDIILIIFSRNPFLESLWNHTLSWKYEWCRSIDVTWDYRIIFRVLSDWKYELIELLKVWTHSQLYW